MTVKDLIEWLSYLPEDFKIYKEIDARTLPIVDTSYFDVDYARKEIVL